MEKTQKLKRSQINRPFDKPTRVKLEPGQSICLNPGTIHSFWGEGGFLIDGAKKHLPVRRKTASSS